MKLRLMTYNVHRCVGVDRDLNIERVAAVIGRANAAGAVARASKARLAASGLFMGGCLAPGARRKQSSRD